MFTIRPCKPCTSQCCVCSGEVYWKATIFLLRIYIRKLTANLLLFISLVAQSALHFFSGGWNLCTALESLRLSVQVWGLWKDTVSQKKESFYRKSSVNLIRSCGVRPGLINCCYERAIGRKIPTDRPLRWTVIIARVKQRWLRRQTSASNYPNFDLSCCGCYSAGEAMMSWCGSLSLHWQIPGISGARFRSLLSTFGTSRKTSETIGLSIFSHNTGECKPHELQNVKSCRKLTTSFVEQTVHERNCLIWTAAAYYKNFLASGNLLTGNCLQMRLVRLPV